VLIAQNVMSWPGAYPPLPASAIGCASASQPAGGLHSARPIACLFSCTAGVQLEDHVVFSTDKRIGPLERTTDEVFELPAS
jgi:hypothetical protein